MKIRNSVTIIVMMCVFSAMVPPANSQPGPGFAAPPPNPPRLAGVAPEAEPPAQVFAPLEAGSEWTLHKTADGSHPDANEQQMMWLMNRARANPPQEGFWLATTNESDVAGGRDYFNVNVTVLQNEFNGYAAQPPAAFDARLYEAARLHSEDLIARDAQDHDGQYQRITAAGFHYQWVRVNVFSYTRTALNGHAAFNIDWGNGPDGMQDGRGHRMAIMSLDGDCDYTNVGFAAVPENNPDTDVGPLVVSENFCEAITSYADHYNRFIVGTVWADLDDDGKYDPGEGIGGVRVEPDLGTYFAVSATAGGYAFPATVEGTYQVTFSGGPLPVPVVKSISVAAESVLLDLSVDSDTLPLKGDVNDDGAIDLEDVILALQAAAGWDTGTLQSGADVNADGRIGIPEALFGLQWIAGFRGD